MTAGVHPTVIRLAYRSVLGRRRGVLLVVLPLVLLAVSVLVRALAGGDIDAVEAVLYGLGLSVITPLVALVVMTGLLAPEIDDGSAIYLLAKPISRYTIVVSKLLVASGCVLVFAVLPMFASGLILAPADPRLGVGYAVGALAGGIAYCALFALLSVLTRHAVVIGLIYLLVWEGILGGLLDGVRWLSITRWAAAVTEDVGGLTGLSPNLGLGYAIVANLVVIVGGTWLAGRRLRSFNLVGDE